MPTFEDILRTIESVPDRPGSAGGFESVARAFRELPSLGPAGGRATTVVAGTNGKGTVAKNLECLLASAGERVGLYTSPHLIRATERIRLAGKDLTTDEFASTFERVRSLVARHGLGRFEAMTAMAIDVFFSSPPPVTSAIFEVGVGGRLDCVNAIPHELAVIARLGLDHEAVLGDTLFAIAAEKFAVARGARTAVYLPLDPESERARKAEAERSDVDWREARVYPLAAVERVGDGGADGEPSFALETPWGRAPLALPGERAAENASLALAAFEALGFDPAGHLPALAQAFWPGRMERFPSACPRGCLYLSGDHNPQGVRSLAQLLRHWRYERALLLVGIGANKVQKAMVEEYERIPRARLSFTRAPFRGTGRDAYGRPDADYDESPMRALETAEREARGGDLIVATGSLYLIGDLRARLLERRG